MRVCRLALVMSVMAAVTASAGAGSIWQWRGDGTGRFPGAQPPTEWGPETNVLWKVLLPGPSNASPIIVGDKIFVCSDQPGKKGTDRVTGLVCVDKNAGGILWSKTVVLSEVYGDEQWQTVLKRRDELAALQRRRGELDKQIGELKRRYDLRTEEARKRDDEGRRKQWERQAAAAKQRGRTIPPYQPLDYGPIPTPEQVAQMTSQSADLRAQRKTVHDQTGAYVDIAPPSVDGVNGYTTPTPVTDGRCVYVLFATGVVACYDLTGERKWAVNVGPSTNAYGQAASPVLAGDRLIVPVNGLRALDKATGRQVWHAPGVRGNYGTPMPITIGGQAMVVTDHGEIVRVEDGQVVARGMGGLTYASPVVCDGVAYFIDGKATGTEVPAEISDVAQPPPAVHPQAGAPGLHRAAPRPVSCAWSRWRATRTSCRPAPHRPSTPWW